jgi:hypothetical protein
MDFHDHQLKLNRSRGLNPDADDELMMTHKIKINDIRKTGKLHLESMYCNGVHHFPSDQGLLGCDAT